MIDCRACRERLNDLLEDDFASNEASTRAELRAHLEHCPDCRNELEFLRAIRLDLRSFQEATAPSDLRAQVRSKLISEKASPAKAQVPIFALHPARFALSGGALLAACCLLLVVRSSQFQVSFLPPPQDENSSPPTQENFRLPKEAGNDDISGAKAPLGSVAKKTESKSKSKPVAPDKSKPAAASTGAPSLTGAPSKLHVAKNLEPQKRTPHPDRVHSNIAQPKTEQTEKPSLSAGATGIVVPPMPGKIKMPPLPSPRVVESITPGALALPTQLQGNSQAGSRGIEKPETGNRMEVKKPDTAGNQLRLQVPSSLLEAQSKPNEKALVLNPTPAGPEGPRGPAALMPNLTSKAAVESSDNARANRGASGEAGSFAPGMAPPAVALPSAPPSFASNLSRAAIGKGSPRIMAVRKADYNLTLNIAQAITLSLLPQQDFALAQIRLTLPDGLQFADAIRATDKPETARIIWRGAVQKGTAIENAVELKALSAGFKNATLALESVDGQNLQTKVVGFLIQEPQTTDNSKAAPVAEDK